MTAVLTTKTFWVEQSVGWALLALWFHWFY